MAGRPSAGLAAVDLVLEWVDYMTNTFENEVSEMYRGLLCVLPEGVAKLAVGPSRDPAGGEDIELTPTNLSSARISVHVAGDMISLFMGRGTSTEVLVDSRRREEQALEHLKEMSKAVIDGRFTEDVWVSHGKVVRAIGRLQLGKGAKTLRFLGLYNPLGRSERYHYEYAPYTNQSF